VYCYLHSVARDDGKTPYQSPYELQVQAVTASKQLFMNPKGRCQPIPATIADTAIAIAIAALHQLLLLQLHCAAVLLSSSLYTFCPQRKSSCSAAATTELQLLSCRKLSMHSLCNFYMFVYVYMHMFAIGFFAGFGPASTVQPAHNTAVACDGPYYGKDGAFRPREDSSAHTNRERSAHTGYVLHVLCVFRKEANCFLAQHTCS
jgi:hypothetical protein